MPPMGVAAGVAGVVAADSPAVVREAAEGFQEVAE